MTADVLAARRGDVGAYARLVESHASVVCAIATAIAGDVRLGEEISQEVFVAAWTGLPKLRNPAAFSTWLRQLARNRAKDALRRRSRRREDFDIGALERLADPGQPPGERLDAERREAEMWAALDELDMNQREVLVLFYREGQSVRQVAALLELTESAVRKRLSRARGQLREHTAARLEKRLRVTRPGQAFLSAVSMAVAGAAPSTAHASGAGVVAFGLKSLLSGTFVGGTLGLAGVVGGYRQARLRADPSAKVAIRRAALAQGLAIVIASVCFVVLPPVAASMVALPALGAVLAGTVLAHNSGLGVVLGLVAGLVAGNAGAAVGLHYGGQMDGWLAAALLLQLHCFIAVPVSLAYAATIRWRVSRWWLVPGALSWVLAAPFLAMGAPIANALAGESALAGAVGLSVAAGLFEETSRLGVYALLARRRTLTGSVAVVLGVAHGGVEALLFGAGGLVGILGGFELLAPESHALFGLSRLFLLAAHVGLTLLVWRAATGRGLAWWALAVLLHIGLDLAAFAAPIVWPTAGMAMAGVAVVLAGVGGLVLSRKDVYSTV